MKQPVSDTLVLKTGYGLWATLTLWLLSSPLLAQKKTTPQTSVGYVVTYERDTIPGQIDFWDWDQIPPSIRFRADTAASFRDMTVAEIAAFGIPAANQLYVSRHATILEVGQQVYALGPSTLRQVHVFMQVLLRGPQASVYQMRDGSPNGRFFVEKEGYLLELINQPYYRIHNGKTFHIPGDLYRDQLTNLCSDAPAFRASQLPGYNETAIRRYFQRYNSCFIGETITYTASDQKLQVETAAIGGVEPRAAFGSYRPVFGLSLRVSQPRRNYNRFVKLNWLLTPAVPFESYSPFVERTERRLVHTVEFTVGTYFGRRAIRPFLYGNMLLSAARGYGAGFGTFLGGGLSYRRRIDLELGHAMVLPLFLPFLGPENLKHIFLPPRIAVHYYFRPSPKNK